MTETISQAAGPALAVRGIRCTLCQARAGTRCKPEGDHLQRWLDAYRDALVTRDDLREVFARVVVITRRQVVPEVDR